MIKLLKILMVAALNVACVLLLCVMAVGLSGCRTWLAVGGSPVLEAAAKAAIHAHVPEWLEDAGLPADLLSSNEVDMVVDQVALSLSSNAVLDAWSLGKLSTNETLAVWVGEQVQRVLARDWEEAAEPDPDLPAPDADAEAGWPMEVSRWIGLPAPEAVRDPRVELSVSDDGRWWTATMDGVQVPEKGPDHWSMGNPAIARAVCGVWYQLEDGSWMGGKYEWYRPQRSWENVHNGYAGHRVPAKGAPIKVAIYSPDRRWRSNVVELAWR